MAAKKKQGHVAPDKTKRYGVIERPTAGPNKDTVTKVFGTDMAWDDAQKLKGELAATRKTKFATVVDEEQFAAVMERTPKAKQEAVQKDYFARVEAKARALAEAEAQEIYSEVASSSLAGSWPTPPPLPPRTAEQAKFDQLIEAVQTANEKACIAVGPDALTAALKESEEANKALARAIAERQNADGTTTIGELALELALLGPQRNWPPVGMFTPPLASFNVDTKSGTVTPMAPMKIEPITQEQEQAMADIERLATERELQSIGAADVGSVDELFADVREDDDKPDA